MFCAPGEQPGLAAGSGSITDLSCRRLRGHGFPVACRIGDHGRVAVVGIVGGAGAVRRRDLNRAAESVISVGSPVDGVARLVR